MRYTIEISAKHGIVQEVTSSNGIGKLTIDTWTRWPLRAVSFRMWLLDFQKRGASFFLDGQKLQVKRTGMFLHVTQTTKCACGCGQELRWRGHYAPNHGAPFYLSHHNPKFIGSGLRFLFKHGFIPWNKGKKGCPPGSEKGWFKKGHVSANYRGGMSARDGYPYRLTTDPNDKYPCGVKKYYNVARLVAAETIGRPLRLDEVVVHTNKDRTNNDPTNLQVMTRAESIKHHRRLLKAGRLRDRTTCPHCGAAKPEVKCPSCGRTAQGYMFPAEEKVAKKVVPVRLPKKKVVPPVRDEEGDFFCTVCKRWFATKGAYDRHLRLPGHG